MRGIITILLLMVGFSVKTSEGIGRYLVKVYSENYQTKEIDMVLSTTTMDVDTVQHRQYTYVRFQTDEGFHVNVGINSVKIINVTF